MCLNYGFLLFYSLVGLLLSLVVVIWLHISLCLVVLRVRLVVADLVSF